jgi:cytochrome b6-f complex iron-sulfur subunit
VLSHQNPIAPSPLPTYLVREAKGVIEVFAPLPPDHPANP